MAALVHLVRHGEVHNPKHIVYGRLPHYGLSERGLEQARDAARYLSARPIVAVWSSPLQRALETAAEIAARHTLPIRVEEELTEWRMADDWQGYVWEELPEKRPGELEAYLAHPWDLPFAAEPLHELAVRMTTAIRSLHERHPEGDIVVVSHQDPIQAARLRLTGRDPHTQHDDKPQHATVYSLQPATGWEEVAAYTPPDQESFPPGS